MCRLQLFLLLSASQAFLLNLCIFWCTTVNSPLATTVTGAALCIRLVVYHGKSSIERKEQLRSRLSRLMRLLTMQAR